MLDDLRSMAESTPPERERHVDLLRAVAIGFVVLGHWLVVAVTEANDEIDGVNALRDLQWIHPLTWLFQVMPVFFFVGGYSNAASWWSHREKGGDTTSWVVDRYDRLVRPAAGLLGILVLAVVVAQAVGADRDLVATGAWLATVPLWFLLAYLAILAVAPLALALHRRLGLLVPLGLVVIASVVDVLRFAVELPVVGNVNYVIVWLCIHQLGFAWRDGRLPPSPAVGWPMLLVGFGALVVMTRWGPYPVSVVTAPGQDEQNTEPPTIAILALAAAQIGVAYVLYRPLRSWLHRRRPWMFVVAVNSMILTVFLWHMAAAVVAVVALYGTGLLPVTDIGSAIWFAHRIPWLAVCAAVLAVMVLVFSPIERSARGSRSGSTVADRATQWMLWATVAALLGGMLGVAVAGPGSHGPLGLPTPALAGVAVGTIGMYLLGRNIRTPQEPDGDGSESDGNVAADERESEGEASDSSSP
jgi:hypothetical protein